MICTRCGKVADQVASRTWSCRYCANIMEALPVTATAGAMMMDKAVERYRAENVQNTVRDTVYALLDKFEHHLMDRLKSYNLQIAEAGSNPSNVLASISRAQWVGRRDCVLILLDDLKVWKMDANAQFVIPVTGAGDDQT